MPNIVYNGEMDKRQGKNVTSKVIPELMEKDPKVVYLDADLMSCIGTLNYAKTSDRAIECGIAEANMIGVAAGLAAEGFKPICHSFGIFSSRRCFDQAFLSAGYAKNDITILGSDAGVSAALNGGTHMPFEDMALYSALPGSTVIDVSDATCLDSVIRQCVDRPGVKYIRFSRKDYAKIYEEGSDLHIGKAVTLKDGSDVVIFASGLMLHEAPKAAKTLADDGIDNGWGTFVVRAETYEMYADGDTRRDATCYHAQEGTYKPRYQDTGYFLNKYLARKSNLVDINGATDGNFNNNLRMYRYAETLLNAAELTLATGGSNAEATGYLNQVHRRAGLPAMTSITEDDILNERHLEFVGEGKRYFDLVRTGKAATTLVAIPGSDRTNSWTPNKKHVPLAQSELDNDPKLHQNDYTK